MRRKFHPVQPVVHSISCCNAKLMQPLAHFRQILRERTAAIYLVVSSDSAAETRILFRLQEFM